LQKLCRGERPAEFAFAPNRRSGDRGGRDR
jgi:hypothetical protein